MGCSLLLLISCQVPSPQKKEPLPAPIPSLSRQANSSPEAHDSERASPFLGIGYEAVDLGEQPIASITKAIRVLQTISGTSAEKAGIRPSDIILRYDGKTFNSIPKDDITQTFKNYVVNDKEVGQVFHLEIFRHETTVLGRRNAQTLPAGQLEVDKLSELIETQKPGEILRLTLKKEPVLKKITAILGKRPNRLTKAPPDNASLFPEYETYSDPYLELSQTLIRTLELEESYADLLKRYEEDEWWDDGFRLKRIRYIHRDPLKLPKIASDIAASLESHVNLQTQNFPQLMQAVAEMLDEPLATEAMAPPKVPSADGVQAHFSYIVAIAQQAQALRDEAFRQLSQEELAFLYESLLALPEKFAEHYSLDNKTAPPIFKKYQKVIELSHKIDFAPLLQSAQILGQLANPSWLHRFSIALRMWKPKPTPNLSGISGDVKFTGTTVVGNLVVGGEAATRYESDVAILIDLGGDDLYLNNAGAARHPQMPVAILIDFSGNDTYSATTPIAQGSGMLGSGFLIDQAGDDIYTGIQLSQGSAAMGTGTLIDWEGADQYQGQEFNQGFGLWGSGLLLDLNGNDVYRSHLFAQGVGAPKGIGLLLDRQGDDHYYALGKYKSSYNVEGLFRGSSQGYGIGFRNYASGGVGLLLDSQGKDRFRAGNFSQGGGYFFGLGILKNGGQEEDRYIGSRYTQGFSAHSAAGILIDEGGDDFYVGKVGAMQAAAWDLGSAALIDLSGNDTYDSLGWSLAQGAAENNGFALFVDMQGTDTYLTGKRHPPQNQYHGGASFSFFIDNGGEEDRYLEENGENAQIKVVGEYGIFVDLDQEVQEILEKKALPPLIVQSKEEKLEEAETGQ